MLQREIGTVQMKIAQSERAGRELALARHGNAEIFANDEFDLL